VSEAPSIQRVNVFNAYPDPGAGLALIAFGEHERVTGVGYGGHIAARVASPVDAEAEDIDVERRLVPRSRTRRIGVTHSTSTFRDFSDVLAKGPPCRRAKAMEFICGGRHFLKKTAMPPVTAPSARLLARRHQHQRFRTVTGNEINTSGL
jgi:hypothetical protein